MAPMVPFITEHVWQVLIRRVNPGATKSVHLADFPIAVQSLQDNQLAKDVALSRRLVELGRAARAQSQVKIRQPLGRALIAASGWRDLNEELKEQIAEELNVESLADLSGAGDLVDISIKANFRALGARYGAAVQEIAQAIALLDAADLVSRVRGEGIVKVDFATGQAELHESDLVITETPRSGWAVASHSGESVALDLELDSRLIAKGIVREAIRAIQDERKAANFDVSDRIRVRWNANQESKSAIESASRHIAEEVLAVEFVADPNLALSEGDLGLTLILTRE